MHDADHVTLWKNGREMNGWFTNPDGVTEFSVQPMGVFEAQNEFSFTVTRNDDQYRVETMPVYTP